MRNNPIFTFFRFTTALVMIVSLSACETEAPVRMESLIENALHQKVEAFKRSKREKCSEDLFRDAEKLVDSIIAQQLNLDTFQFPNKPLKPVTPDLKKIPDSLLLKPIK